MVLANRGEEEWERGSRMTVWRGVREEGGLSRGCRESAQDLEPEKV